MTERVLVDEDQLSEDVERSQVIDSDSRVELLERNLRYIQQQHEIILVDLHSEINRLQQENKDLHYRLINTHSLSSSEQEQQTKDSILPPSAKPLDDVRETNSSENQLHLEEKIAELEKQLFESEENNKYLLSKINELNKILSSKSEIQDTHDNQPSARTNDSDYQNLLSASHEKEQQYLQEIAKLRTVSLEILNTERLSIASKILLRECLTSTNISELSMSKTTTTPIDMLFNDEKHQHRSDVSPSVIGRTASLRHELPLRRLNISPPQITLQRFNNQQRVNLPTITQRNGSTLSQHSADVNALRYHSMSPTDYPQYQRITKFGETPIARRERRTQELQKNRLMKNFFH